MTQANKSPLPSLVPPSAFVSKIGIILEMIKFEHSLFALPFALTAMLVAAHGLPGLWTIVWIVAACVAARSMAMAFNRVVDRDYDARNPRTNSRALPTGLITTTFAKGFVLSNAMAFVICAAMLNPLCLYLSPIVIIVLMGYSYCKRFTNTVHFILGLALGLAPLGAWIAVRGSFEGLPIFLSIGVILWTAGFDIIYSCQDVACDRRENLFSIPARIGIPAGLRFATYLHLLTALCFGLFLAENRLGFWSWTAFAIICVLLFIEHQIVHPKDLSRISPAFFTFNAVVSALFLAGCAVDIFTQ